MRLFPRGEHGARLLALGQVNRGPARLQRQKKDAASWPVRSVFAPHRTPSRDGVRRRCGDLRQIGSRELRGEIHNEVAVLYARHHFRRRFVRFVTERPSSVQKTTAARAAPARVATARSASAAGRPHEKSRPGGPGDPGTGGDPRASHYVFGWVSRVSHHVAIRTFISSIDSSSSCFETIHWNPNGSSIRPWR